MSSKIEIPTTLPLLPIKETTPFPHMLLSLYIGRSSSKKSVEEALHSNRIVFLTSQKDSDTSVITENSVCNVGVAAIVMRTRKLKNGRMKILVQGLSRGVIEKYNLNDSLQTVQIKLIEEISEKQDNKKIETLIHQVKNSLKRLSSFENQSLSADLVNVLNKVMEPGRFTDLITGNLNFKMTDTQKVLETFDPIERLALLQTLINKEIEIVQMQNRIKNMVQSDRTRSNQSSHFSQQRHEGHELDAKSEEIRELSNKIKDAEIPEDIEKETRKHLYRLEKMHPEASEASIIRNYLDWMCSLPWNKKTTDHIDLNGAQNILDEDHFGLSKVKERILEFLAVRQLQPNSASNNTPILCFVGPPGVGKTSLGVSIARSVGRKYTRIALGGIKDEAEIRGHRKTYVGAMPGKIIQALKQVQSKNPVIVLDELDKLGSDFRGDPAAAMLEVLDPEQNHSFKDHYLNANFDLSQILFIATANIFENIPAPLRDRMETIAISGYTPNEKLQIAEKYIVKKEMDVNGIKDQHISFTKKGIQYLIDHYTKEAGLRNLKREVGSICRKTAKKVVMGEDSCTTITPDIVKKFLGCPKFLKEDQLKKDKIGIVTGLAWTQFGGEILYVESIKLSGKDGFTLTGQLGKVMEESAKTAFSYVRSYSEKLGVNSDWFKNNEIHIHLPAGAIPKDGPSAGVTLATSLISLITQTPVRKDVAMTGEIGLQGQVLPVGGIKEKALAALNHGIKTVILPKKNMFDLDNIDGKDSTLEELKKNINFIFVETLDEVFQHALSLNLQKEKPLAITAA